MSNQNGLPSNETYDDLLNKMKRVPQPMQRRVTVDESGAWGYHVPYKAAPVNVAEDKWDSLGRFLLGSTNAINARIIKVKKSSTHSYDTVEDVIVVTYNSNEIQINDHDMISLEVNGQMVVLNSKIPSKYTHGIYAKIKDKLTPKPIDLAYEKLFGGSLL